MRLETNGVANLLAAVEIYDGDYHKLAAEVRTQSHYLLEYLHQIKQAVDTGKKVPFWHEVKEIVDQRKNFLKKGEV
jgi:hypothetical protein